MVGQKPTYPPLPIGAPSSDGYYSLEVAGKVASWSAASSGGGFTAGGDLTGTSTSQTVAKIHGSSVPIGGSLTTGNVLQVSGGSALSYGPVNLAGGSGFVSGTLPAANQASQTVGGDLTGNTASANVIKLQGNSIEPGTLTSVNDGYVLTWNNSVTQWQPIPIPTPSVSIVRATPIDANTLIRWKLDESTAPTVSYPNTGNGSAQTIVNVFNNTVSAPVQGECGILGPCILCTGNNGVTSGDTSLNEPSGNITISLWFRPRVLTSGCIIFQKAYGSGGAWSNPYTSVWISTGTVSGDYCPWSMGLAISGSLHQTTITPTGYLLKPQVWNFLAVTRNITTTQTLVYYNGLLATHDQIGGVGVGIDWGTHGPWDIGGVSNSGGLGSFINGWIDDVRVENVDRSATYLANMYQLGMYGSLT